MMETALQNVQKEHMKRMDIAKNVPLDVRHAQEQQIIVKHVLLISSMMKLQKKNA